MRRKTAIKSRKCVKWTNSPSNHRVIQPFSNNFICWPQFRFFGQLPELLIKLVVVLYFILIWKASLNWRQPLLAFLISYWWNESRELNTKCSLTARSICRRHQKTVCCPSVRPSIFWFFLWTCLPLLPPSPLPPPWPTFNSCFPQHNELCNRFHQAIARFLHTMQSRCKGQAASGARRHLFAFLTPLLCNIITSIIFSTIQTKIYSCSRCLFFGQTKKQFSQKALRLNV